MSRLSNPLAIVVLSALALGAGAASAVASTRAPAAASPTPLVQSVDGHRSTGMAAMHAPDSVTARLDGLIARADGQFGYAPAGTAEAFSPTPVIRKLNLSPAGVRQLIAHGLRVQVSTENVGLTEARLFVYERTLARGGVASAQHQPADLRDFISPITRLYFTKAGTQNVTLRVNHDVQAALLRAGSITVGITNYGYESASAG